MVFPERAQRKIWLGLSSARKTIARAEPLLYAVFAGFCTLWVATEFYASLRLQTLYSVLWNDPSQLTELSHLEAPWSAPLDDVFIHFDFARSTARGYPFQWSEGNGYSSGGTSLLYPFVLALGYWMGFRDQGGPSLMVWAAMVACVSVFATLLASRSLFSKLPRYTSYLAPLALLSVGALDWTLFSGMEVALFLGIWGGTLVVWDSAWSKARSSAHELLVESALLGVSCALLVATRPEAAGLVALFALSLGAYSWRSVGTRKALLSVALSSVPGAVVVIGHAVANHFLTGDSTAAGALVKLEVYHPYLTLEQVWDAWKFHLEYQILRVTNYHFSALVGVGWIVWGLAAIPLFFASTRRYALVLWASAACWVLIVAFNGQVRWQNERYAMPAVAWLLLCAGLGVGAAFAWASRGLLQASLSARQKLMRVGAAGSVAFAVILFWVNQAPRFRDQVWFFGRASRNILDQHVRTGKLLRFHFDPPPSRVLVSDAGAIPYAADIPALDLIGLGGFHGLPFAKASRLGVSAAVELIERIPPAERPDLLALYPSWWGVFPIWFGHRIGEVPVRGNVICGGVSKVLYEPDWTPLALESQPFELGAGERVVDSVDFGDVVSEEAHGYQLSKRGAGHVAMKLLPHPSHVENALFDAGRVLGPGVTARFSLSGLQEGQPARLVFRAAPAQPATIRVVLDGEAAQILELEPHDGWVEYSLPLGTERVRSRLDVRLEPVKGFEVLYHLFAVQVP